MRVVGVRRGAWGGGQWGGGGGEPGGTNNEKVLVMRFDDITKTYLFNI